MIIFRQINYNYGFLLISMLGLCNVHLLWFSVYRKPGYFQYFDLLYGAVMENFFCKWELVCLKNFLFQLGNFTLSKFQSTYI